MSSRPKRVLIGLASQRAGYTADVLLSRGYSMIVSEVGWSPNTDIFETEEEVVIRLEAAGLEKDKLSVSVRGDNLIIRGNRPAAHPCAPLTYQQMEISYGPFEKVFVLPEEIRNNPVRALYHQGMLEVIISKESPDAEGPAQVEWETE